MFILLKEEQKTFKCMRINNRLNGGYFYFRLSRL